MSAGQKGDTADWSQHDYSYVNLIVCELTATCGRECKIARASVVSLIHIIGHYYFVVRCCSSQCLGHGYSLMPSVGIMKLVCFCAFMTSAWKCLAKQDLHERPPAVAVRPHNFNCAAHIHDLPISRALYQEGASLCNFYCGDRSCCGNWYVDC